MRRTDDVRGQQQAGGERVVTEINSYVFTQRKKKKQVHTNTPTQPGGREANKSALISSATCTHMERQLDTDCHHRVQNISLKQRAAESSGAARRRRGEPAVAGGGSSHNEKVQFHHPKFKGFT